MAGDITWKSFELLHSSDMSLRSGDVHVWRFSLEIPGSLEERLHSLLSEDERARADRFYFPKDRRRYIVPHAALRLILQQYLHRNTEDIHFLSNRYGKPYLPGEHLEFNLSHSHEMGLVAVAFQKAVGVDIERIQWDFDYERIAERFFSPDEIAGLQAIHPDRRVSSFFHGWARKEAFIKAKGQGLSIPLRSFSVSLDSDETEVLLRLLSGNANKELWSVRSLPFKEEYAAALAVEGEWGILQLWDFSLLERPG